MVTREEVFQYRDRDLDEHHARELTKALGAGFPLDPVTLWKDPETGELVVLDGHHRLAAYKAAGWSEKVPALVHECDIRQARLLALGENSKTRLALSNDEKLNAAWKLVIATESYSKREIVQATKVADGTVAAMRRTLKALKARDPDGEADIPERWWQAKAELNGREQRVWTEEEMEERIEAREKRLDEKIGKTLGDEAQRCREAAIRVVASRLGVQALRELVEEYAQEFGFEAPDPGF